MAAATSTTIDITARVTDQTSSGVSSALSSISRLETSLQSIQRQLTQANGGSLQVQASLRDNASQRIRDVESTVASVDGSSALVESTLQDNASQQIRDVSDSLNSLNGDRATVESQLQDNSSQPLRDVESNLNRLNGQSANVSANLRDYASAGLNGLSSLIAGVTGRAVTITATLLDYATAPIQSIIDLVKSPITQVVTLTGVTMGANDILNTYSEYEQGIANTWAKLYTSANEGDRELLEEKAKYLGATTQFTAAESANAFTILSGAGWTTEQILAGAGAALNLSSAGGVDMLTSANTITGVMAGFGMKADDADVIADILARTESSSKANVAAMQETFTYFAGTAGHMGWSLEDASILTGILANNNKSGSSAGTTLSNIFTNLINPTDAQKDAMDSLGLSIRNNDGTVKDGLTMIYELRDAFDGLSDAERIATAETIAGSIGREGLLAILAIENEELETLIEAVYDYSGAAAEMAAIRLDTVQGDMAILASSVDDVKIAIGERLAPSFREFIQYLTEKMPEIRDLINSAFDWWDDTYPEIYQTITTKVETVTGSEEYQNGTIFQKVHLLFDELVADPFLNWWDNTGRASLTNIATMAGETLGGMLSGALLTLFGADTGEIMGEGALLGQAFMDGFTSAFNFDTLMTILGNVVSCAGTAISALFSDVSTLASGEDASSTALMSAGLLTFGAAKTGAKALTSYNKASSAVTAAKSGTAAALLTPVAAATAVTGTLANAVVGTSKAEEWTGSSDLGNQAASGFAAVIGGTFDGIANNIIQTGLGAATGLAVSGGNPIGAAIGAGAGLVGSLVGGENIAQLITGTKGTSKDTNTASTNEYQQVWADFDGTAQEMYQVLDQISAEGGSSVQAMTELADKLGVTTTELLEQFPRSIETISETTGEALAQGEITASEGILDPITGLFDETLPETMNTIMDEAKESLSNTSETAVENITEPVQSFIEETVPTTLYDLMDCSKGMLKSYEEIAAENLVQPVDDFFQNTLPESLNTVLDNTGTLLAESSTTALTSLTESTLSLFEESIPLTFQDLWFATESQMLISSAVAQSTINQGVLTFYEIYIPSSIQSIWDNAMSRITASSATASATVNTGISSFFTSASSSVSSFFSSAQSQMNSAMSSASAAISSLSLSVSSAASSSSSSGVTAYANGGILSTPHIGLVAEAGPEAIIPLSASRRSRGIELWEEAGEMLGVTPYANGGILGKTDSSNDSIYGFSNSKSPDNMIVPTLNSQTTTDSGGKGEIKIDLGGITLNLNVETGKTSEQDNIIQTIRDNIELFTDDIADQLANRLKDVFANMSVSV